MFDTNMFHYSIEIHEWKRYGRFEVLVQWWRKVQVEERKDAKCRNGREATTNFCLERSNRVEKCELIRAPPTNVTHARTREYGRCFTCSHSAELQLVLRALVYTQTNTEPARWRLSATQMCMRAWRVYASLSSTRPRVRKYTVCTALHIHVYQYACTLRRCALSKWFREYGFTAGLVSIW